MDRTWNTTAKPKQHHVVEILLRDGTVKRASFLKDINKYVRGVNSWRLADTGKYVPDGDVKGWREECPA